MGMICIFGISYSVVSLTSLGESIVQFAVYGSRRDSGMTGRRVEAGLEYRLERNA